jgi:hypothetical protein
MNINALIAEFRKTLPAQSATAVAIDNNESRTTIGRSARREGYLKFAQDLDALMRGGGTGRSLKTDNWS